MTFCKIGDCKIALFLMLQHQLEWYAQAHQPIGETLLSAPYGYGIDNIALY